MQFMDNVNLGNKSTIRILDLTRVNQASHTINLRKESKLYKDMAMNQFNKEVEDTSKNANARVSSYIAKAMQAFVKGGKKTTKIRYFFT
jgi:hypothetical protein